MVTPSRPFEEGQGVAVARDRSGTLIGFRDPETGRFISRTAALERVHYDPDKGKIIDSFGNSVGVGAFRLPKAGASRETEKTVQTWSGIDVDPRSFRAAANQEIVEKVTVINKDGTLRNFEISYGMGGKYDPKAPNKGAKWRYETSKALGLPDAERQKSSQLRKAVAYREFIVRTTSAK